MKVALCFLIYDKIEFESVWEHWIKTNTQYVSIYIHSKYTPILRTESFRCNAQIVDKVETAWGSWGLVDATLVMFEKAMKDSNNTHCILLSGSCIPVKKFSYIYEFLHKDNRSFIYESNKDQRFPRYNNLLRSMNENVISKHSQWIILNSKHTELLVKDKKIIKQFYINIIIPDESWALTYLQHIQLSHEICTNISTTYCNWNVTERSNNSPKMYLEISEAELGTIFKGPSLFARKFLQRTLIKEKNISLNNYLLTMY